MNPPANAQGHESQGPAHYRLAFAGRKARALSLVHLVGNQRRNAARLVSERLPLDRRSTYMPGAGLRSNTSGTT